MTCVQSQSVSWSYIWERKQPLSRAWGGGGWGGDTKANVTECFINFNSYMKVDAFHLTIIWHPVLEILKNKKQQKNKKKCWSLQFCFGKVIYPKKIIWNRETVYAQNIHCTVCLKEKFEINLNSQPLEGRLRKLRYLVFCI